MSAGFALYQVLATYALDDESEQALFIYEASETASY